LDGVVAGAVVVWAGVEAVLIVAGAVVAAGVVAVFVGVDVVVAVLALAVWHSRAAS
jgi:hypothetical protein